jgi:hypothetical protein
MILDTKSLIWHIHKLNQWMLRRYLGPLQNYRGWKPWMVFSVEQIDPTKQRLTLVFIPLTRNSMEKENIKSKNVDFRNKLKELQRQAIRQVREDRKENNPRRRYKVLVPLLLILVVAFYFVGKIMLSHQPASTNNSDKLQITEYRYPVPPDQTESNGTFAETESSNGIHSQDILSDGPMEEATDVNIPLFEFENEYEESPLENYLATNSEKENEFQAENQTPNPALSDEYVSHNGLDSVADGDMESNETEQIESVMSPPPSSVESFPPHGTRIAQNLVCSEVKARRCVPQYTFALNQQQNPHVWMEVYSDSVPYTLTHVYYHEGRKYVEVPLRIKYPRMRTWSYITLKDSDQVGSWHVEIVAEDGTVLGRAEFKVTNGR